MPHLHRLIISDVFGSQDEFSEQPGRKLLRDHPTLNCSDFGKDLDDLYHRLCRVSAPVDQDAGGDTLAESIVLRPNSVYLPPDWMGDPENVP